MNRQTRMMTVASLAALLFLCACDQPVATAEQSKAQGARDEGCAERYYYDLFGAAGGGRVYCAEACASTDAEASEACA